MWIRFTAFLMILFLAGCGAPAPTPETPEQTAPMVATNPTAIDTPLTRELDFAFGEGGTNLLSTEGLPSYGDATAVYDHYSFAESLIDMISPESLEKYEGSYTIGDLRADNDQPPVYSLKSSWVLRNKSVPEAGIKVARNPVTGKYEVSGGEVFLQNSGVGVSYEKDEGNGESKTFLNWKRDF